MSPELRAELDGVKAKLLSETKNENEDRMIVVGFAVLDEFLGGLTDLGRIADALETLATAPGAAKK